MAALKSGSAPPSDASSAIVCLGHRSFVLLKPILLAATVEWMDGFLAEDGLQRLIEAFRIGSETRTVRHIEVSAYVVLV